MRIKIEASRFEILNLSLTILLLFMVLSLLGGFFVGHQASSLIGFINPAAIPPNSIGGSHIQDLSITSNDIASNAVVARVLPDNSVTAAKIAPGAITGAKVLDGTINSTKISSFNWSQITSAPTWANFGGIGYTVPSSLACNHPTQGLQNTLPKDIEFFGNEIVLNYEWYSSTIGGCPGSVTFEEYICSANWRGPLGFDPCICSTYSAIPCP